MRMKIKIIIIIQSLLLLFIPVSYAGNFKVDPKISWIQKNLENLRAGAPPVFLAPPSTFYKNVDESDRISVFIYPRDQAQAINEIYLNGGKIKKVTPNLIAAQLDFAAIFRLAKSDSVTFITPVRPLTPQLDIAVPLIGADRVHRGLDTGGTSYQGENVITGLVDTGIDLSHPDFHHPDGSTRILWL